MSLMVLEWCLLLVCGWFAGTVSGAAGFGGALLLLPVLTFVVGAKAAVPILTIAQLLGNASRAGFGWRDIQWRPAFLFSTGAIPASFIGSRLFVDLTPVFLPRAIGFFLLLVLGLRHTELGKRKTPQWSLAPAGAVVGLVSAIAGSAGPRAATVCLGLNVSASAYVATEALTAVLLHLIKSIVYGYYAAIRFDDLIQGVALGCSLMIGSWTGRKLISQISYATFTWIVEVLLLASALSLILRAN